MATPLLYNRTINNFYQVNATNADKKSRKVLFICGIFSSLLYPLTDLIAGNLYKGYNFNEQAVSELFAIGAPTSRFVVTLFTMSSILLLAFALGVWLFSEGNRILRALSMMIFGNAVNSLILWNFFPMHLRGEKPSFTDTMHGILAVNPFVLITIVLGAVYFKNWFRYYSIGTILLLLTTAILSFSSISLVVTNQPTPGLGITERVAQYAHQFWHVVLAVILIHGQGTKT